jgi:hypothetical protein
MRPVTVGTVKKLSMRQMRDIREKRLPGLRRRARVRFQQPRDRALRDGDGERSQFTVNPWRAPQRVRGRHLANKSAHLLINAWTTMMALQGTAPAAAKPVSMPADNVSGCTTVNTVRQFCQFRASTSRRIGRAP